MCINNVTASNGGGSNPLQATSSAISVSGVIPFIYGVAGLALTVSYDPKDHLLCGGVGVGLSAGHTVGGGPVVIHAKPGQTSKDVLGGWSWSGGYNFTPWWGLQGSTNSSCASPKSHPGAKRSRCMNSASGFAVTFDWRGLDR